MIPKVTGMPILSQKYKRDTAYYSELVSSVVHEINIFDSHNGSSFNM